MCRVLEISESGYYAWRNRKPSPRSQANEKLLAAIRGVLVESGWTYGAPRIAAQLCKSGVEVSVNRVARLMQKARLSACAARKFVRSTRCSGRAHGIVDRVNREFNVSRAGSVVGGGCDLSAYVRRCVVFGGGAGRL